MLAITNGKIYTMTGEVFDGGTLLIKDGKIEEVGQEVAIPENAKVIDAKGKYVFPGFIDAHSHIGIFEEAVGEIGEEGNEWTDPVTPQLRAIDAINPADQAFEDAVMG